jgi:hypothetical protein
VTERANLRYDIQVAKRRDCINNKDLEAWIVQIECLQNVCEETEVSIVNKNRVIEDKSVRSNTIKDKKLHIFTINNDIKISCDNKKQEIMIRSLLLIHLLLHWIFDKI